MTLRTCESNALYDLPGQTLRKRGELLRLRKYGTAWLLTHKARSTVGRHKTRVETQTAIADGEQLEKILLALGYVPSFRYEKFRTTYTLPGIRGLKIELDETPVGIFLELEGPPQAIDRAARLLGYARKDYLKATYGALYVGMLFPPTKKLR